MTIYEALKKDHKKVGQLLDQLVASSENGNDKWKSIIDQIRDELIPHARAEESVFYNAIRETGEYSELIGHGFGEHAVAEAELRTLQAMKTIDVNWTKLAKKLRADILHHVAEEEGKIFAAAQKVLSDQEALAIGKAFEALKPRIKEESFAKTSMDFVVNMLPVRFVESFKKSFSEQNRAKKAG